MPITLVGTAQGNTSAAIPAGRQAGDLILIVTYRGDNNSVSSATPTGYTSLGTNSGDGNGMHCMWKISDGTETVSPTFTNSTGTITFVYRGVDQSDPIGSMAYNRATTTADLIFADLTLEKTDGTSWIAAVAGAGGVAFNSFVPSGMVYRNHRNATYDIGAWDTNGGVADWNQTTMNVGSAPARNITVVIEVRAEATVVHGNANGATISATSSLISGSATVGQSVAGSTISASASLISGSASATGVELFDDASNGVPNGWSAAWVTTGITWTEKTGGYLESVVTAQGRHAFRFDTAGILPADQEVVARIRNSHNAVGGAYGEAVIRGSGAAGSEQGYRAGLQKSSASVGSGSDALILFKYLGDGSYVNEIAHFDMPFTLGNDYYIRLRGEGTVIKAKAWAAGTSEPAGWQIELDDNGLITHPGSAGPFPGINTSGWVGLFNFSNPSTAQFSYFAYASNGATAPITETVGGSATANGATLTAASALTVGTATGSSSRTGSTLSATTSIISGTPTSSAIASGATVTSSSSVIKGTSTGSASRTGQTLTGTSVFTAGTATGAASRTGVTLPSSSAIIVGTASAGATKSGVTLSSSSTIIPGAGLGGASQEGVIVVAASSIIGGGGETSATAPGATITSTVSLLSGTASGNAFRSGETIETAASVIGGIASGGTSALGVTLTGSVSVIVGEAAGSASAAGHPLSSVAVLIPGTASGVQVVHGNADGAVITMTAQPVVEGIAIGAASRGGEVLARGISIIAGQAGGVRTGTASGTTLAAGSWVVSGVARAGAVAIGTQLGIESSIVVGEASVNAQASGQVLARGVSIIPGTPEGSAERLGVIISPHVLLIAGVAKGLAPFKPAPVISLTGQLIPDVQLLGQVITSTELTGEVTTTTELEGQVSAVQTITAVR